MPEGRPSRYQPIGDYLAALPPATTAVTLTFAEIEGLLGAPLPLRAVRAKFWANARRAWYVPPQARAWHRAGWRVAGFDPVARTVTFARADSTDGPNDHRP